MEITHRFIIESPKFIYENFRQYSSFIMRLQVIVGCCIWADVIIKIV